MRNFPTHSVAVIGLDCTVPSASNAQEFWANSVQGKVAIRHFSSEELLEAGVEPSLLRRENYVRACGYLDNADQFDAAFFKMKDVEAAMTDPQHRLLLQCAWHALESAGIDPMGGSKRIGCFVGAGMSLFAGQTYDCYLTRNLLAHPELISEWVAPQITVANRNDYAATKLAYAFDLKGPAVNVQAACCTGLATVHQAISSLLLGECDTAIAGAASVHVPLKRGYLFEGGLLSPDGSCRPFDRLACGTVGGSGAGIVVLRRLEDAITDGNPIRAVIRGSAMNNDGKQRVSFLAPSIEGQVEVIRTAMDKAGVQAQTIGFLETHGTGTPLGDLIEISSLTTAYRQHTLATGFCALGATKGNIGHLDTAAGIISLIKTVLVLEHGVIPPLASIEEPNPAMSFEKSPFWIPRLATQWDATAENPRRAGISCFGAGGTNVHMIVQEPPPLSPPAEPDIPMNDTWVLPISARTSRSVATLCESYRALLLDSPPISFADIAKGAAIGRHHHSSIRAAIVASNTAEAVESLGAALSRVHPDSRTAPTEAKPRLAMLFPGQGLLDADVARAAYNEMATFRQHFDRCSDIYEELTGCSLSVSLQGATNAWFRDPSIFQSVVFATSVSLFHVWKTLGIQPSLVIGHSLGEYAAAYVAQVMDLESAMRLVEARGRLISRHAHAGGMLVLGINVEATERLIATANLQSCASVSGQNSPRATLVSGTLLACTTLREKAEEKGWTASQLDVTHAFHSHLIEPAIAPFHEILKGIRLHRPVIDIVRTSRVIDLPVSDHAYWLTQLRQPVNFMDGMLEVRERGGNCLLEMGTGRSLLNLAEATLGDIAAIPSLGRGSPLTGQMRALAALYEAGLDIDWRAVYGDAPSKYAPCLPRYPFDTRRHWVEPRRTSAKVDNPLCRRAQLVECRLSWQISPMPERGRPIENCFVVGDTTGSGRLTERLRMAGIQAWRAGADMAGDLALWMTTTQDTRRALVYFPTSARGSADGGANSAVELGGLTEALRIVQSMLNLGATDCSLVIATRRAQCVSIASDAVTPTDICHAALWGLGRSLRREVPDFNVHLLDVTAKPSDAAEEIIVELSHGLPEEEVAWNLGQRHCPCLQLRETKETDFSIRGAGVYIISGGWGGLGLAVARHLVRAGAQHLILVGRRNPDAAAKSAILEIENLGAQIETVLADVSQVENMTKITAAVDRVGQPLRGVVHAAGIVQDATLANMDEEDMLGVFESKLFGALNLDRLARNMEPDFFVAFSSAAALLGAPGQANYCAANAAMDAVMTQRLKDGYPATTIHWGPWKGAGMAVRHQDKAQNFGLVGLDISTALNCFDRVLQDAPGQIFITQVKPDSLPAQQGKQIGPLTVFARRVWEASPASSPAPISLRRPSVGSTEVLEVIVSIAAQLADVDQRDIAPHTGLMDIGIDSMMAMQLRARLNQHFGVQLPPMAMFTDGTPQKLAEQLERLTAPDVSGQRFDH